MTIKHKPAIGKYYLYTATGAQNPLAPVYLEVSIDGSSPKATKLVNLPGGVLSISDGQSLKEARALLNEYPEWFTELGGEEKLQEYNDNKEIDKIVEKVKQGTDTQADRAKLRALTERNKIRDAEKAAIVEDVENKDKILTEDKDNQTDKVSK